MSDSIPLPVRALAAMTASLFLHVGVWRGLSCAGPSPPVVLLPPETRVTFLAEGLALTSTLTPERLAAALQPSPDGAPPHLPPPSRPSAPGPEPGDEPLPTDRARARLPTSAERHTSASSTERSRGGRGAQAGGERGERPPGPTGPASPEPGADPDARPKPTRSGSAPEPRGPERPHPAPGEGSVPPAAAPPGSPAEAAPTPEDPGKGGRRRTGETEPRVASPRTWLQYARAEGPPPATPASDTRFVGARDARSPVERRARAITLPVEGARPGEPLPPPPPSPPADTSPSPEPPPGDDALVPALAPADGFRLGITDEPPPPTPPRPRRRPIAAPPPPQPPAPTPEPRVDPPDDRFWAPVLEPLLLVQAPPTADAVAPVLPEDLQVSMVAGADIRGTALGRWAAGVDDALRAGWRWPAHLQALDVGGVVIVEFEVRRDGRVLGLRVARGSGVPELDYAALGAVPERVSPPPGGAGVAWRWEFRYGRPGP